MPDTPQALADRLREEGARVIDFFNNLSQEQWSIGVYPQMSDWNMHHLLAHFVSAEIGRRELILNVSTGGEGSPPNFDIDAYKQKEVERLSCESSLYLLELFSKERTDLIDHVSQLKMDDLMRMGRDPFLGITSLLEMIKLTYLHLQIHLRDARRCL